MAPKRVLSFKMSEDQVESLDSEISERIAEGELPEGHTRSDVIRGLIQSWVQRDIDDLQQGRDLSTTDNTSIIIDDIKYEITEDNLVQIQGLVQNTGETSFDSLTIDICLYDIENNKVTLHDRVTELDPDESTKFERSFLDENGEYNNWSKFEIIVNTPTVTDLEAFDSEDRESSISANIESPQEETKQFTSNETTDDITIASKTYNFDGTGVSSLAQEAMEHLQNERAESSNSRNQTFTKARIVAVGCGGAGVNILQEIYDESDNELSTIGINTDKQQLEMHQLDKKILIGKDLTNGLGTGGDIRMGRAAAKMATGTIKESLGPADLVFITAGMGGGTGTGGAPVVADIAKKRGAIVIAIVTLPFSHEQTRRKKAEEGITSLRQHADSTIIFDNNRLVENITESPIDETFSIINREISDMILGIAETINTPSLVNLDYADLSTIMNRGGVPIVLTGKAAGENVISEVTDDLLEGQFIQANYNSSTGALLQITGGPEMSLLEAEKIANEVTAELDSGAKVIWGAKIKKELTNEVHVTGIISGVESQQVLGPTTEKSE